MPPELANAGAYLFLRPPSKGYIRAKPFIVIRADNYLVRKDLSSDTLRSHQPLEMKSPARKITTFSAGMARAGARAPRVKRCACICARPPAQRARSGPPLSRDPVADILGLSFAGLIVFLGQGSGSNANLHSKRQATLQEFGFASVKKVLPSFAEHTKVMDAFQGTSAECSTPESVHMNVGVYFASKSRNV